jgi:hypothetical protein
MFAFIILISILTQSGIQVTQGVISTPRVLQKEYLTDEEMKALQNTIGGVFMGVSDDSNYIFVNEKYIKIDKRTFNFKNLPTVGEDVFIRLEERGKDKIGVFCSNNLDDAVYYKKGLFK